MADEKTAEILKLYSDLTPNEKHLVGVFVNAMILSRNKNCLLYTSDAADD